MHRPHSTRLRLAAALLAASVSWASQAQPTASGPRPFKVPASEPGQPPVAQQGSQAQAMREKLKRIRLPPGFRIELFAVVPDARHMAVAPGANMLFVGTRKSTVWAVSDRNGDGIADEVKAFAPSLQFLVPNGVCWTPDGALIVAERNRVLRFPGAASSYDAAEAAVVTVVERGKLIPPEEESGGHAARTCRVGPDGRLYITLGQPFNVPPRDKLKLYSQWGIGGIVRMSPVDGSEREVFATGLRNSVGQDFNPKDGSLWFTDNQTDNLGDDIPNGLIYRADRPGLFFGFPYIQGTTRITQFGYDKEPVPANTVRPEALTVAHAADLGMVFYTGRQFPPKYRGAIFSAQHGSWNRKTPVGARVMVTYLKPDGHADRTEPFAEGWLDERTGSYHGRPVDVAVAGDGALLVSDDAAGAIYRITYQAP